LLLSTSFQILCVIFVCARTTNITPVLGIQLLNFLKIEWIMQYRLYLTSKILSTVTPSLTFIPESVSDFFASFVVSTSFLVCLKSYRTSWKKWRANAPPNTRPKNGRPRTEIKTYEFFKTLLT
jgi:hypothetical protein